MLFRKCVAGLGIATCLSTMIVSIALADREVKFYNISVSGHRAEDTGEALKYHHGRNTYGKFRIS